MAQVQNGRLYIRYRSNSKKKTKQRSEKSLQTTSLCYSIAKSSLKPPLTFSKVEKTKRENFDFVHLLSSFFFFFSINSRGMSFNSCSSSSSSTSLFDIFDNSVSIRSKFNRFRLSECLSGFRASALLQGKGDSTNLS